MKLQRDLPLSELSSSVTSSCGKIGTSSFLTRTTQPTENGKEVCPETSPVRRSGTSTRIPFLGCWILTKKWAQRHIHLISRSPATLVVPTIVFLSLCACGFALTFMLARSEEEDIRSEVLRAAAEKGQWFSDQLHQAILPLFSMAQFVNQLEIFQTLPEEIGPAFENNSLPFVDSSFTHRNVTGVCDRPDLVQRFSDNFQVLLACDENLVVCADRLRLQQVVLNLGRNAAKFVGQGFVRLRATCVGDDVCIYVEDSGPSIPMGKRKDLFCRFQESLDSLSQGTGIGLNLCKELVDLMGGSIFLDESYISGHAGGDGTRIVINLRKPPIESSGSDNPELETLCASADECNDKRIEKTRTLPAKLSVLIVDDERILRKLASRSISKIAPDWSIREAASGETVLQLITCGESFDLIFMDQYMTSTDRQLTGTETVRELRSRRVNSIVCGLSANDLQQAFTGAGANYFIMKPFPCKAVELETELLRITECIDR